ncbi:MULTISPECIES: retropepsin-like aspartic protease family protein [unclassified Sphingopyxis]|uniref:retropepsin-like aspartic protease family protein n=1 Tax=unclassified Sphingopyxis TaxID=2614943 RepID=UPI000735F571|nr:MULTISPECIES: TIGR02281 family clan AA aspartic protease [unclassified Sphingopyxis]KTE41019.1 aspartyl protease [Sphingopyxis sp. HIX]KTE82372.1 aspartyl protease [Sphingopyxis sp. HXXIV]
MLGRFILLVAGIAAISVGVAGVAIRSTDSQAPEIAAAKPKDDGGWSERGGGSSSGPSVSSSGEVRLGRAGDSHFYADANVDGTNIRMMVDSGASVVALTRRDAEAVGIDVDSLPVAGMARTAGGDVPMRRVVLDSVDIDGIEVRRVEAAVVDADMGVSLLGQSYLAKLDAVNVEGDTMTLR